MAEVIRGAKIVSLRMLSTYVAWRPFQADQTTCYQAKSVVILQPGKHREPRGSNHRSYPASSRRIYRRRTVARCTFVGQTGVCPTKVLLCEVGCRSRVAPPLKPQQMEKQHKERKVSYKYSFRLDEQQNIRFCRMLAEAGLEHNRSRFIVKRIFAEEFRVCLLYTSPSPRDRTRSRMPSSA